MNNDITFQRKRSIADKTPLWTKKIVSNNQCGFVCPHATIRPVRDDEELQGSICS